MELALQLHTCSVLPVLFAQRNERKRAKPKFLDPKTGVPVTQRAPPAAWSISASSKPTQAAVAHAAETRARPGSCAASQQLPQPLKHQPPPHVVDRGCAVQSQDESKVESSPVGKNTTHK
ncbi:uncharacterized protein LOC133883197 isoform X2 [Phragmites australis]|uniref:uncharacterized protein LOC133883197 isoform X2 n=1 Tax=Phragmites australis TaxID=29695 RepID=UPI002D77BECA|nr:uncharacterized protein LOC133883197 isoform X2 [Phragmites australis]